MKFKYKVTNVKTGEVKYIRIMSDVYKVLLCRKSDIVNALETNTNFRGYKIEYNAKGFKTSDVSVGDEIEIEGQKGIVTHIYDRTFVLEVENGDKLFVVKQTMKFVHDRVREPRTRKTNVIRMAN